MARTVNRKKGNRYNFKTLWSPKSISLVYQRNDTLYHRDWSHPIRCQVKQNLGYKFLSFSLPNTSNRLRSMAPWVAWATHLISLVPVLTDWGYDKAEAVMDSSTKDETSQRLSASDTSRLQWSRRARAGMGEEDIMVGKLTVSKSQQTGWMLPPL